MKSTCFAGAVLRGIVGTVVLCVPTTPCHGQPSASLDAPLHDLTDQGHSTRQRGLAALLGQGDTETRAENATRMSVIGLIRSRPDQAERIKLALITALERLGDEYEASLKAGVQLDEGFSDYSIALTKAVGALQDPRAVKGLLKIGGTEALSDVCPVAVDAIIERAHGLELSWRGSSLHTNAFSVRTLGLCIQHPAMMRQYPEVATKIKNELLNDLESADSTMRLVAVEALSPLRTDPMVQAKLQQMAASDPFTSSPTEDYLGPEKRTGLGRFLVREAASRALNPPSELLFYVTRTSSTGAFRVISASATLAGEKILGPETAAFVKRSMCNHLDPAGRDPSMCWSIEPVNGCSP